MKKLILALAATLSMAAPAWAQWTPGKEVVKVIIPFAPGGGADQGMRHLQKYAEERGIRMIPVYKPGAEGLVGTEELAKSAGDGMTIFYGTVATVAVHQMANPNYRFKHVSLVRMAVMSVVANANTGIKDVNDFERDIKDVKSHRVFGIGAPGQRVTIDALHDAVGSKRQPKIISYKGSVPAIQDLVGGHIDYMMVPLALVKTHVDSGKLRLIMINSDQEYPDLGVPVIKKRYAKWPEQSDGFIISLPASVKPEAEKFWSDFIRGYMSDKQVLKDWRADLFDPEEFSARKAQERVDLSVRMQSAILPQKGSK